MKLRVVTRIEKYWRITLPSVLVKYLEYCVPNLRPLSQFNATMCPGSHQDFEELRASPSVLSTAARAASGILHHGLWLLNSMLPRYLESCWGCLGWLCSRPSATWDWVCNYKKIANVNPKWHDMQTAKWLVVRCGGLQWVMTRWAFVKRNFLNLGFSSLEGGAGNDLQVSIDNSFRMGHRAMVYPSLWAAPLRHFELRDTLFSDYST